jgi:penicillin-binding protein 2
MIGEEQARLRLGVLGVVAVSLLSVLFVRAYQLQGVQSNEFAKKVDRNKYRTVITPATRGRILGKYDDQLVVLAGNATVTVVTVDRKAIVGVEKRNELFSRLAPVLGTTLERLQTRFNDGDYQLYDALPLAEGVDDRVAVYLNERIEDYPGIDVRVASLRTYPYGTLASHVVGYIGAVPKEGADQLLARGYQLSDRIGRAGVERSMESVLRGTPGKRVFEVNEQGRVLKERTDLSYEPISGNDVVLTLDLRMQQLAESALRDVVAQRQREKPAAPKTLAGLANYDPNETFSAPGASAVILNAKTGAVVAMASYPTYHPQELLDFGALLPGRKDELAPKKGDKYHLARAPLVNRAVSGRYQPGSTFKLVSAWGGVSHGVLDPNAKVDDTAEKGTFRITGPQCKEDGTPGCKFSNSGGVAYGSVDLASAITRSSDYYFYKFGYEVWTNDGPERRAIQNEAEYLGMGRVTGVQLAEEAAGFVPDQAALDRVRQTPEGKAKYREWKYPIAANINTAVGQGLVEVTPLQLANAYTTFATRGTRFVPSVIDRVIVPSNTLDPRQGELVQEFGTRTLDPLAVPANVYDPISKGLRGVVADSRGTAFKVFETFPLNQVRIAGKTGTAQDGTKRSARDTSLFASYAPADDPQYTVVVVVEKAGFGSQAAAPVARVLYEALYPQIGQCKAGPIEQVSPIVNESPHEPAPMPPGCVLTYGSQIQVVE